MTKYFIKLKEDQTGPFTIEELKEMNLTDQYWYWTEGYTTWRKIEEVKDLQGHILRLPPSAENKDNKIKELKEENQYWILWITLLAAPIIFFLLGGFSDKYDLLDDYPGLASSSYGDDAALKIRAIILGASLLIGFVGGLYFYLQRMMTLYKKPMKIGKYKNKYL